MLKISWVRQHYLDMASLLMKGLTLFLMVGVQRKRTLGKKRKLKLIFYVSCSRLYLCSRMQLLDKPYPMLTHDANARQ